MFARNASAKHQQPRSCHYLHFPAETGDTNIDYALFSIPSNAFLVSVGGTMTVRGGANLSRDTKGEFILGRDQRSLSGFEFVRKSSRIDHPARCLGERSCPPDGVRALSRKQAFGVRVHTVCSRRRGVSR